VKSERKSTISALQSLVFGDRAGFFKFTNMKFLLSIVATLILISASAQTITHQIPERKDDAIVIRQIPFDQVIQTMIDNGAHFKVLDATYHVATVEVDCRQNVYVHQNSNGEIIITSDIIFSDIHMKVGYFKSDFNRFRWDQMVKYLQNLPNMEYAKL